MVAKLLDACVVLLLLFNFGSSADFYVKPSAPSTGCPSGETPCRTLQEYADQHTFSTNNSRFLFLQGEHRLDNALQVNNVLNLSLVGASPGVKIVGSSFLSNFSVEAFTGLTMENLYMSNFNVSLTTGSKVNLAHVESSSWVRFEDVVGNISIINSTFTGQDSSVAVVLINCQKPVQLNFSKNHLSGPMLDISVSCSGAEITVTDSTFEDGNPQGLSVDLATLSNSFMLVRNCDFRDARIFAQDYCSGEHCFHNSLIFSSITLINSALKYFGINNTILVADSIISSLSTEIEFRYNGIAGKEFAGQVTLRNVTISNSNTNNPIVRTDNAEIILINSTFENNLKTALKVYNSKLVLGGWNVFRNNSDVIGGAIQVIYKASIKLTANSFVLFEHNHADYVGGAILVNRDIKNACPLEVDSLTSSRIDFIGNTANRGGSSIYNVGNDLSLCNSSIFVDVFNLSNSELHPSAFASDPYGVCFCNDERRYPDCSADNKIYSTHAFPGQEFSVRLAAVSAVLEGVVPGAIRAYSSALQRTLDLNSSSQASSKSYCENLYYSVKSTENVTTFNLTSDLFYTLTGDPSSPVPLSVTVFLMDCPAGFSLSNTTGSCECDSIFDGSDVQCFINNQSFQRPTRAWVGVLNESGVAYHPNCPSGYCLPHDVIVTGNTSDSQCESHRGGLLCGQCQDGYSLTLGDGKCAKCSSVYILLILPLAVAGLLLVAVLFALNLTVTEGTINGLIFYANVVAMTHNILFSGQASYLYTFVAWLNLDLGISTCLYDGLDGYAETWLQLIFPVYLWVIVLIIIQLYNRFPNRLPGKNAVQVLATLFLLSYTKLQRIVITIMSFTKLEYSTGDVRYVWLYDANLDFFKGKHLFLGLVAILILIFIIVPYTLLLVFFQQLQALSDHKLFKWVNKLKPVFDAYAGAYQDKYRFWTGMLLVVRTLLIILFTMNTTGSADINLLIILIVSLALLMGHSNAIYKMFPLNYLERFFYVLLGIFAAGIGYARHINGNVTAAADVSFGVAIIVFLGIISYHLWCRIPFFQRLQFRKKGYVAIDDQPINH